MKDRITEQQEKELHEMDMMFGIPPCRFLSMLNVKHDRQRNTSQNCMFDIAEYANKYQPKVFLFENAPRLSSAKIAFEMVIPRLMDRMPDYKFAIYKTTTLNHGLPQNRLRTFWIAYKDEHRYFDVYKQKNCPITTLQLIGDLQNQQSDGRYVQSRSNAVQEWFRKDCKEVTRFTAVQSWFYWKNLLKYCEVPNKPLMFQIMYQKKFDWQKLLAEVTDQKDHDKLEKIFSWALKKERMGKGYWDASPILAGEHINRVISKNAYRLVHPNKSRLLTVRQLRRFMGIPDRFVFRGTSNAKALHQATQNVPSWTYADVREECKKHVTRTGDIISTDKRLIYIENIADKNVDKYYRYTKEEIMSCEKGLGRDNKFLIGKRQNYAKPFLERIKK